MLAIVISDMEYAASGCGEMPSGKAELALPQLARLFIFQCQMAYSRTSCWVE